ncbi:hypothetical protein LUZ60_016059 [Juncus effusus]|nr:hypothetical protein LUZ60_016059 [Juncus effusus]
MSGGLQFHGLYSSPSFILNPKLRWVHNPVTANPSSSLPPLTVTILQCLCPSRNQKLSTTASESVSLRRREASFMATASADPAPSTQQSKPFSVLFVCLGNICRSPAAEAVFRNLVEKRGLESQFLIDSAGTIGYHEGDKADSRMIATSKRRGIEVTSISRPIKPSDFRDFDLILAMDRQNKEDILSAYERWKFKEPLPEDAPYKVKLMCSYCKKHSESEVPDPYYGGPQGFEKVLDLLEDACESLLDSIHTKDKDIATSS